MIEIWRDAASKQKIRRTCFDGAVARYRRCFNGGIRTLVPKDLLESLTQQERDLHDEIFRLANQAVAHCVDGSEENIPVLIVGPREGKFVPFELTVMSGVINHHNKLDIAKFKALAQRFSELVKDKAMSMAVEIMNDLQNMTPPEIKSLPEVQRGITETGEMTSLKYSSRANA
jgi:hypothetical protein